MSYLKNLILIYLAGLLMFHIPCKAQFNSFLPTDSVHSISSVKLSSNGRKWIIGSMEVGLWTGSFISLNKAWYANYPRSSFHLYNDWREWQHMDKAGHFWSSYHISHFTSDLWEWTGTNSKKAHIIGAVSSLGYLSIIEILDGYSDKWGFSVPDMAANSLGVISYLTQQMAWDEQRIKFKLSYNPYPYGALRDRSNQLFGKGMIERILKDYNSQTYWASLNIKSFFPSSNVPNWLDLSLGYGAKTMLGGFENKWTNTAGNSIDRTDIQRFKRYFLSIDVDLDKIKTKNKVLKKSLHLLNVIKIPAPAIELTSNGKFKIHPLYF